MNAPPKYELFDQEGETKITYAKDTMVDRAGTFTIQHEDHTLGSLIRMQLLNNPRVLFAGYRIPHPLVNYIEIKVQTSNSTTPEIEFMEALSHLKKQTEHLDRNFNEEVNKYNRLNFNG